MHVLCSLGWVGLVNVFLIVDFLGWGLVLSIMLVVVVILGSLGVLEF